MIVVRLRLVLRRCFVVYRFDVEHIRDLAARLQSGLSLEGDDQRLRIEQILLKAELDREFSLIDYDGEAVPSLTEVLYTVDDLAEIYHRALGVNARSSWLSRIRKNVTTHHLPVLRRVSAGNGVHISAGIEKKHRATLLGKLGTPSSELQIRNIKDVLYVSGGDAAHLLGINRDRIPRLCERKIISFITVPEGHGEIYLYSVEDLERRRQQIYEALIKKQLPSWMF